MPNISATTTASINIITETGYHAPNFTLRGTSGQLSREVKLDD
jgi:hypothetical protein